MIDYMCLVYANVYMYLLPVTIEYKRLTYTLVISECTLQLASKS